MTTRQLPRLIDRVRVYFAPVDPRVIQLQETNAALSEPARVVLWHLCGGGKKPEVLARILREARISANIDQVLTELESADLITHDEPGLRFIKPDQLAFVRKLYRR